MNIKVLGAHNSESKSTGYMSLLVDNVLALDAGSLTSFLSFRNQMKIKAVLLTHGHYDHIRDIPAFAMNLFLRGKTSEIFTHRAVYDILMQYFFDGKIYPDFQTKPADNPTLRFNIIEPYKQITIGCYKILPVPVIHSLTAMGYQINSEDGKSVFYTGDTGPELSEVWNHISPQVLFIELTAPNIWEKSMRHNGHMTPDLLKQELMNFQNIRGYLPKVVAVHMNPEGESKIKSEISRIEKSSGIQITLAREGMRIRL
jgi:ribonuclease BN (tRNA processing enzyme)